MIHGQTVNALDARSGRVIISLRRWAEHLRKELVAQRSQSEPPTPRSKYSSDPDLPETITLRWIDVENLMYELRRHATELSQFTSKSEIK